MLNYYQKQDSGSGSGFQISLDQDPVSAPRAKKKECRKGSKSLDENLSMMTKDCQEMKKATTLY